MSKWSVFSTWKSKCSYWTLLVPKYCAWAVVVIAMNAARRRAILVVCIWLLSEREVAHPVPVTTFFDGRPLSNRDVRTSRIGIGFEDPLADVADPGVPRFGARAGSGMARDAATNSKRVRRDAVHAADARPGSSVLRATRRRRVACAARPSGRRRVPRPHRPGRVHAPHRRHLIL